MWEVTFNEGTFKAVSFSASSTELIAITTDSVYRIRVIPIGNVTNIRPVSE